jgi:hypothetical protein
MHDIRVIELCDKRVEGKDFPYDFLFRKMKKKRRIMAI